MTAQAITQMGNPILRHVCKEVKDIMSPEVQSIITDLIDSLNNSATPWVGIAAPQIWVDARIFIIHSRPTPNYPDLEERGPEAIINPSILSHGEEVIEDREWCLSTPWIRAKVPRRKDIQVAYKNKNNISQTISLSWFTARIFQHEYDHLDWILFIDKVIDKNSFMMHDEFVKRVLHK